MNQRCKAATESSVQETPPEAKAESAGNASLAAFLIDGQACRIVDIAGIVPRHVCAGRNHRPRLVYVEGELAHFELHGHRFAIVREVGSVAGEVTGSDDDGRGIHDTWTLLTPRELQIVQLISMGYLTKQVADRLRISEFTVRSYLKTVYCKLNVRSRAALVLRYVQTFSERASPGDG